MADNEGCGGYRRDFMITITDSSGTNFVHFLLQVFRPFRGFIKRLIRYWLHTVLWDLSCVTYI